MAFKEKLSKFAKLEKAAELALTSKDTERVQALKVELSQCLNDLESADLECMSEEDRKQAQRSVMNAKRSYETLEGRLRVVTTESALYSQTSVHSSASSNARRRAELRKAHLEKRHELQRREEELERQRADVRREIELQDAQHEVECSELSDDCSSQGSIVRERTRDFVLSLPSEVDTATSGEAHVKASVKENELYENLRTMTFNVQESLNLPKPEILTFSENPADYCKFMCNFETNIESRICDNRLRLSYLIQFCQGDAKRSIEDCVVLPSDEGYVRAKQILKSRYGKPHLVVRSHVEQLINGNTIKNNDVQGLMNLSLEMEKCQINVSQVGFMSDINNTENLRKIVRRLPMHLRSKWVERASRLIEQGIEPSFNDLLTFVKERAIVANTMYGHDLLNESKLIQVKKPQMTSPRREKFVTLSTSSSNKFPGNELLQKRGASLSCVYCREGHKLIDCPRFKLIDLREKLNVIRMHKMCENCLNFKHYAKFCRKASCCEISGCNEKHHTMLHSEVSLSQGSTAGQSNCCAVVDLGTRCSSRVSLRIVPVVVGSGHMRVKTYALLDEGSDVTLCSDELVRKLGAVGIPREFTITTVNKSSERKKGLEVQFKVSSLDGYETVNLDKVWTVQKLHISLESLPDHSEVSKYRHLDGIDLPRIHEGQVELLIGGDVPEAFWVEEERLGRRGEPYAIRSLLGWSIIGPAGKSTMHTSVSVHFQQSLIVQDQINKLWITDFPDMKPDSGTGMSQEDRRFRSMMENSIVLEEGHYKLGLPWGEKDVCLPNNKSMATVRLGHLKKKLERNEELCALYKSTMKGYIEQGYAERVVNTGQYNHGRVWYLPHHPVLNPKKPDKVRIVFDCEAKFRGMSLNDSLLQGPDYMNSIVGVLMRFRQEPVAPVADIEAMFHQVKVSDSDKDALRFLWWPDGEIGKQPMEYRMNVHLFGATSSPSCAAFSLKRTAQDNADAFSVETVSTVERNFYVDDLLKSVADEKVGVKLARELREMLSLGGFRLTKWVSNSREVLSSIPESERADTANRLDFERDTSFEKALGLQWYVERDCFVFDVSLPEKGFTRRGILSVASSLFDPLGLVAPVTLIPKLVLQNACRQKLGWDEKISDADAESWSHWLASLSELSKVSIERCLVPRNLDRSSTRTELHIFSDASEKAYGSAAYLKIYDASGNNKCSLVIGKSRLAPIKTLSIPRLELAAAAMAVKLYQLVSQELDMEIHDRIFWTDSMIVLGYINNEKKRFKTFVANRLAFIHEITTPRDWRYVPSKLNPADLASRGFYPYEMGKLAIWLNGPDFLSKDRTAWPETSRGIPIPDDDTELKPALTMHVSQGKQCRGLDELLTRFPDWHKLQRAVAWLIRFKNYLVKRYLRGQNVTGNVMEKHRYLTVNEIRSATVAIFELMQREVYGDEIKGILRTGKVSKSSSPPYTGTDCIR